MALIDDTFALIAPNLRSIGGIIPDCTIEEHHFDRYVITEHPVETGVAVTDHAFRAPTAVTMKIGFSNSTARTEGWVQQAYEMIRVLADARQPFDVFTGKRAYQNMVIDVIDVSTDASTEYMLNCTVSLREIIFTSTQQTSGGAPASQQATPSQTASPQASGTQQLITPPNTPPASTPSTGTPVPGGFRTPGVVFAPAPQVLTPVTPNATIP